MRQRLMVLAAVLAVAAAACGGTPTPEGAADLGSEYTSDVLNTSYEGALSAANQLALGTMLLEGTENGVDPEQADDLLPLWQAMEGGVTAEAEAEAVLKQIEATMTEEQLEAIAAMELTLEGMQAWMADQGYGFGPGTGGFEMSPEMEATLEAGGGEFPFPGDGEFAFPQEGEMPEEMATRVAEMQDMTDEEREAMRATVQAGGGFGPGGAGQGGPWGGLGGRGGGRRVGFLVRPLIELLETRAAEG